MSFLLCQTIRLTTIIALILLTDPSITHRVRCSQVNVNVPEISALKPRPRQIMQRQASDEMPTAVGDEDIAYCESVEKEVYCSSGVAQSFIDVHLCCGDTSNLESDLRFAAMCYRSESGAFCGSFSTLVEDQNFEENCLEGFDSNDCPPNAVLNWKT